MGKKQQHNTLTNLATPQAPIPPTIQTYLEAVDRAARCQAALQDALLTNDTAILEARLAAFSQARGELGQARAALLQDTARWVRAMFRPWKGVRYG
jgi:hypothetical protein